MHSARLCERWGDGVKGAAIAGHAVQEDERRAGALIINSENKCAAIHDRRTLAHTNRLCSTAAAMKLANSGCGSNGRLFSSG